MRAGGESDGTAHAAGRRKRQPRANTRQGGKDAAEARMLENTPLALGRMRSSAHQAVRASRRVRHGRMRIPHQIRQASPGQHGPLRQYHDVVGARRQHH